MASHGRSIITEWDGKTVSHWPARGPVEPVMQTMR